jgi:hypothetical protein
MATCRTLINPEMPIPAGVEQVRAISEPMERSQPRIEQVLLHFIEFLGAQNLILLAHDAPFNLDLLAMAITQFIPTSVGNTASPYLFCQSDGTRILRIARSFHSTLKRAGIEGFRFHDLRHTFASHLAMRSVSLETIGALLGHKDPKMTKRYAHLSRPPSRISKVGTKREHGQKLEQR